MDAEKILTQLANQSKDNKTRSKSACLNDIFDGVEQALKNGLSRQAVIEILAENGLELSLKTFSTTLSRLRKRRKAQSIAMPAPNKTRSEKTLNPAMALPKTKEAREEFAKSFVDKKDTSLLDLLNKGKSK